MGYLVSLQKKVDVLCFGLIRVASAGGSYSFRYPTSVTGVAEDEVDFGLDGERGIRVNRFVSVGVTKVCSTSGCIVTGIEDGD